jgi:nucleoside-diphosphate-sugar epimerase
MRLAIFGLGFVGDVLRRRAEAAGHVVDGFSRRRGAGGGGVFDAGEPDCGRILEGLKSAAYDCAVVTFPPAKAHASFWPALHGLAHRRMLLGTTGIYRRAEDCSVPVITEQTPLTEVHPRLAAELAFGGAGGIVVRLAGLFGGERNPVRWIRDGRVGYEKRQANLVHGEDVARALLALAALDAPRAVYNLADGQRHTWREIVDALVKMGSLAPLAPQARSRADGFVAPQRLLADLPGFVFTDFWELLEGLAAEDLA